jgi:hypothetical protein
MSVLRKLLVIVALLSLATPALARDEGRGSFAGVWTGRWSNSLGESGDDSLVLSEDPDGDLRGTWTDEVPVAGRRTRRGAVELRGRTRDRSYVITATVKGNRMTLAYDVTPLDGGDSYHGTSRLVRIREDVPESGRRAHLGKVWTVSEPEGWRGNWVRRKGTDTFDAEWTNRDGETAKDVLEIESVRGDRVILVRRGDFLPDGTGRYFGTLSPDGKSIEGTASWYKEGKSWTATIE